VKDFPIHGVEDAPEGARDRLAAVREKYGFLPNLMGVMAGAPPLLASYLAVAEQFSATGLTSTEQQVVLLSASRLNGCKYCMAAHSAIATMQELPSKVVQGLRDRSGLDDPKLEALRQLTEVVVRERGRVPQVELAAFLAAGYSQEQVLEVVLGVGLKTLSNYTNHLAHTPVDEAFEAHHWEESQSG